MATTFNVFNLGNFSELDVNESDGIVENADLLINQTFGDASAPLYNSINTFAPAGNGATTGTDANAYDFQGANDQFSINGAGVYTVDAIFAMSVTITYVDGTTASGLRAVIVQDDAGNMYLVGATSQDGTQDLLEAQPIQSVTMDSVMEYSVAMVSDRDPGDYDDVIDGTSGADSIVAGFTDTASGNISAAQVDDSGNTIVAGDGNDTILAGAGNDYIDGGAGDDSIRRGGWQRQHPWRCWQ